MNANKIRVGDCVRFLAPAQTCYGIVQGGTEGKVDAIRFDEVRVMVPEPFTDGKVWVGVTVKKTAVEKI